MGVNPKTLDTRTLRLMHWGLVPYHAKDAGKPIINARAETLAHGRLSGRFCLDGAASCRPTASTSGARKAASGHPCASRSEAANRLLSPASGTDGSGPTAPRSIRSPS